MFIDILDTLTRVFIIMGIFFLVSSVVYFFRKNVLAVFNDMKILEQGNGYGNFEAGRYVFDSLSDSDVESARGGDTGRVSILGKEEDTEALGQNRPARKRVTAEERRKCHPEPPAYRDDPEERTKFLYDIDEKTELLGSEISEEDEERTELLGNTVFRDDERTALLGNPDEEDTDFPGEDSEEKTEYLGGEEKTEYLGDPFEKKTTLLSDPGEEEERTELLSRGNKGEEETTLLAGEEGDIDIDEEVAKYLELGDQATGYSPGRRK